MPNVANVQWTPATNTQWVTYHVFMRPVGDPNWVERGSSRHPRCFAQIYGLQIGTTYECTVLCSTRLNVWNDFAGAPTTTFTLTDASPPPSAPTYLGWTEWPGGATVRFSFGPGTYSMEVWISRTNDRATATLLGAFRATVVQFTILTQAEYALGMGAPRVYEYVWLRPLNKYGKAGDFYPGDQYGGIVTISGYVYPEPGDTGR